MDNINKILLVPKHVNSEDVEKLAEELEANGYKVEISELEEKLKEDSEDEEELIYDEVEGCDALLVLIGDSEEENDCINKQIEEADNQEKQIVGIYMGGGSACVPSALEKYGEGLLTNDIKKIVSILKGNTGVWEEKDGTPRKQKNTIEKGDC